MPDLTIGEALEEFLKSSSEAEEIRKELIRFSLRYGKERHLFTLNIEEIEEFVRGIKKAAERRKYIEALEKFFGFAAERGWLSANPAALLRRGMPSAKPRPSPAVRKPSPSAFLTEEGREKLRREMDMLLKEKQKVLEEMRRAAEDKDFRENAPYHAAKERLAQIESRIREIKLTLSLAQQAET